MLKKFRHFVQGLRADIPKTVLFKQPKTFREAKTTARLACSVENTMNRASVSHMASQLDNLSQAVKTLITSGGNKPAVQFSLPKDC